MSRLSALLRRLSLRKTDAAPSPGIERLVRIVKAERAREASQRTKRLLHPAH